MQKKKSNFQLPRSDTIDTVELKECKKLDRMTTVPDIAKDKYSYYVEGEDCNAILKTKKNRYPINKKDNDMYIRKTRVFCNEMQNIRDVNQLRDKSIEDYITKLGKEKGTYHYNYDQYEYEGKGNNTCTIYMDIAQDGTNKIVKYNAKRIYLQKPEENE